MPADLWEKQVGLLRRDCPYDSVMATRVLGQGYAYLLTAMSLRGQGLGLAPSKLVDIGAHTIILDTVAYAELCDVARAGWEVDLPLWEDAADCGPCHPGNDSH